MIGLYVNLKSDPSFIENSKVGVKCTRIEVGDFFAELTYHEVCEKQTFFEDGFVLVLVDGWVFNSSSYSTQAEFVAELYQEYGLDAPLYLNGQFNILVVDKANHRKYFWTDIYSFRRHFLSFEDGETKISPSLLSFKRLGAVDKRALVSSMDNPRFNPVGSTYFERISQVGGAELVSIDSCKRSVYSVKAALNNFKIDVDSECFEEVENFLSARVLDVHKSSSDVLLHLSGGLDSRFLGELFLKSIGGTFKTFSFGNVDSDELNIAREVARRFAVDHIESDLIDADFTKNAERYIKASGGLDIFPQSFVYSVYSDCALSKVKGRVFDSGFALDAMLGGSNLNQNIGDKLSKSTSREIDESYFEEVKLRRIFGPLCIRQGFHRVHCEDRYSMYDYSVFGYMSALKPERIYENRYYYKLAAKVIEQSKDVTVHATDLPFSAKYELWAKGSSLMKEKEQLYDFLQHDGLRVASGRYFSDYSYWIRFSNIWNDLFDLYLLGDKSSKLKLLLGSALVSEINESRHKENIDIRRLIKLVSMSIFLESHEKV